MLGTILISLLVPLIYGYLLGRNQIDPNTAEGKSYYE